MAFHNAPFPDRIEYGAVSAPGFETEVVASVSGKEVRNSKRDFPLLRFDVSKALMDQADLDAVIAHHRNRKGKLHAFPMKDWTDYEMDQELQVSHTANGAISEFQLAKTYTDNGGYQSVRPITLPVQGTIIVEKNGVDLVESVDWTMDYGTGIVSLTSPLAAGEVITASGEFRVKVRYDTDDLKVSITHYDTYAWGQIPLVEVLD